MNSCIKRLKYRSCAKGILVLIEMLFMMNFNDVLLIPEGKNNEPETLESLMEAIQGLNRRLEIHGRVVQKITTKQNVTHEQVHARSNDEEETENILFVSNDAPIFSTQDDHPTTNAYEGTPQLKDENEIPCDEKKNDIDDPNEKELVKHIVGGDST
ncbi:hypothetical protein V6N12_011479 [Hibiscus sabdariffa]|uniref:Uncharacterized protein n=1 Tax=Hibiscus sabdariffa TaxID=183260 RepID=A0ABR2BNK5_9ROSI